MKYTRRKFLENACFITAAPFFLPPFLPLPSIGVPKDEQVQEGIALSDMDKLKEILKQKTPAIWVFTGDSITHGAKHTRGYRSYPEIFGERIRWEIGRVRDIVINTGISGNTTQTILNDFDWRVRQFKPAVVSLMIGTNDCSKKDITPDVFETNLDSLVNMIRELRAIPILHTPNVIIKEKAPERANLSEYVSIIQSLAEKRSTILVDNWSYWQNTMAGEGKTTVFKKWLNDPLHPNGAGHSEITRLMFKELSIFDSKAATCGGEYYEGEH